MSDNVILPKGKGNFYAGVLIGDWIYCSMYNVNGLYRKNIKTGEQENLGRFDKYNSGMGVHEMAFLSDDSIFFVPMEHREKLIAVYGLDTQQIEYLELPYSSTYVVGRIACTAIDTADAVWVIPCVYDAILRIDKATHEIKRYDNWPKKILEDGISKAKFSDAVLIDGKIYICPYDCSGIVIFDVATATMEMIEIEIINKVYRKIVSYNQKLYLFPENFDYEIIIFDLKEKKAEKCKSKPINTEGEYHAITCINGRDVWMFPYEGGQILKFDLETHKYDSITVHIDQNKKNMDIQFWDAYETGEKALIAMGKSTSPFIVVEGDKLLYDIIELSTDEILHGLFDSIKENDLEIENVDLDEKPIGSIIYSNIKGSL